MPTRCRLGSSGSSGRSGSRFRSTEDSRAKPSVSASTQLSAARTGIRRLTRGDDFPPASLRIDSGGHEASWSGSRRMIQFRRAPERCKAGIRGSSLDLPPAVAEFPVGVHLLQIRPGHSLRIVLVLGGRPLEHRLSVPGDGFLLLREDIRSSGIEIRGRRASIPPADGGIVPGGAALADRGRLAGRFSQSSGLPPGHTGFRASSGHPIGARQPSAAVSGSAAASQFAAT